jgi:hypothetical protein
MSTRGRHVGCLKLVHLVRDSHTTCAMHCEQYNLISSCVHAFVDIELNAVLLLLICALVQPRRCLLATHAGM